MFWSQKLIGTMIGEKIQGWVIDGTMWSIIEVARIVAFRHEELALSINILDVTPIVALRLLSNSIQCRTLNEGILKTEVIVWCSNYNSFCDQLSILMCFHKVKLLIHKIYQPKVAEIESAKYQNEKNCHKNRSCCVIDILCQEWTDALVFLMVIIYLFDGLVDCEIN